VIEVRDREGAARWNLHVRAAIVRQREHRGELANGRRAKVP
jgi:hypothetical protein